MVCIENNLFWRCSSCGEGETWMAKADDAKICPVCGSWFSPRHRRQKYCSQACCRYANRHGGKTFDGTVLISDPHKPALRTFLCKHCGAEVRVTEKQDLRTKFCSQHCENLYWKHSKRQKRGLPEHRSFVCRCCGTQVDIACSSDRRTIFCSHACSARWHARNRRVNGKA